MHVLRTGLETDVGGDLTPAVLRVLLSDPLLFTHLHIDGPLELSIVTKELPPVWLGAVRPNVTFVDRDDQGSIRKELSK